MTPERWDQIKAVLAEALRLEGAARRTYLDAACGNDAGLRLEVESLLASAPAEDDHFLDPPALRLEPPLAPPAPSMTGRRIGPYQLFDELGRGGMGDVYRARRADGQYDHEVAIKLIRGGYEARRVLLERFKTERQILASLDHANIARLLDGGAADDGSPYLVMELIEGENICDFCDAKRLNITARLSLFRQVCSAVQYAHQRLIVHRDIKPSNILVPSDGVPKLLDFGVAKILAPTADAEATLNRPMTLAYASPEQIRGETMTTTSDVYSLGVVLYQLLSGHSPYRRDTKTPGGLYRAIDEDEPVRPSAAVARASVVQVNGSDVELTAEAVSAPREGSPARLTKRLGGDLDQIVLKTLRKEPGQRYASVEQLSQDIERHLRGFPVLARQGTWTYHTHKFVQRHQLGIAATAVVASVTVAGVGATLRESRIAAANARRAEERFEQVRTLANAMVFDVHDAIQWLPGSTKPRELIVRLGLEYLDQLSRDATADTPLQLQAAGGYIKLGRALGEPTDPNLGNRSGAAASYRKAIGILERLSTREPGNRDVTSLLTESYIRLTRVVQTSAERWALAARVLALRQADAAAHPDDLQAQRRLASAFFENGLNYVDDQRYQDAVAPFRRALAIFEEIDRRTPTPESARNVALCDKRLAALSLRAGNAEEALKGFQAARAIDERRVALDPQNTIARSDLAYDLSDTGTTLRRLNRNTEALDVYARVIDLRRRAYDADRNDARARRALASILFRQGFLVVDALKQPQAGIALLREASELWAPDTSPMGTERGEVENRLAEAYDAVGNPREAQTHRVTALSILVDAEKAGGLNEAQRAVLDKLRTAAAPTVQRTRTVRR